MTLPPLYLLLSRSLNLSVAENLQYVGDQLVSGQLSWNKMVSAGSNHLILQNIFLEYKKHDLLGLLPEDLQQHLYKIHQLSTKRNLEIVKQSKDLSVCLSNADIEHLFTKGVGHLLDKVYENIGGRIMGDIDVVVRNADWLKAVEVLKAEGYYNIHPYNPKLKHTRKHYPRLIKKDAPVEVEMHYIPTKYKYSEALSTEMVFENTIKIDKNSLGCLMNDRMKIIHNFMHSQMDHEGHKTANIHLRNLYDLLLLSKRENPVQILQDYKHFQKQSSAYLSLVQNVFRLDFSNSSAEPLYEIANTKFSTKHFLWKHSLHTNYPKILLFRIFFMRVPYKIFHQFIQRPFLAFFDKEIRDHILGNIGKREAWVRLVRSYGKFFGGGKRGRSEEVKK